MVRGMRPAVALAAVVWLGACGAQAQQNQETTVPAEKLTSSPRESSLSSSERKFLQQAARGSLLAIELGKVAGQKAKSNEVQQLGARVVQDHQKALGQLEQLAKAQNIKLPTDMGRFYREAYERVSAAGGMKFDPAYAREVVRGNKIALGEFRQELPKIQSPQLKSWMEQVIASLEAQQKMAVAIVGDEPTAEGQEKAAKQ